MGYLEAPEDIPLSTGLIRQSPAVSPPPPDGHIPLPLPGQRISKNMPPPADFYPPNMPMPMGVGKRQKGRHYNVGMGMPPPPLPVVGSFASSGETNEEARESLLQVQSWWTEANSM